MASSPPRACVRASPSDRVGGRQGGRTRCRGALGGNPFGEAVTRILVMSEQTLPLAEIKKRLSEIVDGVEQRHDRVVLTRHGRPAAIILSPDDLESLEETLDILSNPAAMREIRESERAIDDGDVVSADQLRAKYLTR